MARKKRVNYQELMIETEKLLLERGYDAFHFGLLAERLGVGRSTIYDYYTNKDELISAYIHSFIRERVEESKQVLELEETEEQLRVFLRTFMKYNHIQQIVTMIAQMEEQNKEENEERIKQIKSYIKEISGICIQIVQRGKAAGKIRSELNDLFISYVLFNLIQIPNFRQQSQEERLDELIDFLLHGVSA
ncbi:MAG: TetR/AcrR family transcriptional regulator [Bacillus sp. (in: firmicutes)]